MRLLLDTHISLWYVSADTRLPERYRDAIRDRANSVYLSVASVWECVVKYQLGKLPLPSRAAEYVLEQRRLHQIDTLPIDEGCLTALEDLPQLHRDPFDRILIAQSLQYDLTLVTADKAVLAYGIRRLPAE